MSAKRCGRRRLHKVGTLIKDTHPPARPPGIYHSISRMHFVQNCWAFPGHHFTCTLLFFFIYFIAAMSILWRLSSTILVDCNASQTLIADECCDWNYICLILAAFMALSMFPTFALFNFVLKSTNSNANSGCEPCTAQLSCPINFRYSLFFHFQLLLFLCSPVRVNFCMPILSHIVSDLQ
jgi:hypothetical protein